MSSQSNLHKTLEAKIFRRRGNTGRVTEMVRCTSGPFLEDGGRRIFLYFIECYERLPISPSLVNPDETQSWIVVDHRDSWFTWVPVRLLLTLESSIDQVKKMFSLMTGYATTSRVAKLEDGTTDKLAVYLHSKAHLVDRKQRRVVLRVKLVIMRYSQGLYHTSNDVTIPDLLDGEIKYLIKQTKKEFLRTKLLRFQIEVDEGCDHNGPCSICFEDFHVKLLAKMPCGHVFHDACITKWLKLSLSCPLCKYEEKCKSKTNDANDIVDISNWIEAEGRVFVIKD